MRIGKEKVMDMLKDKVAIITGAAKGNGAGIAKAMAREGASVCLWDIAHEVEETVEGISESGLKAAAFNVDITDSDQVNQATKAVIKQFVKVDILVNNAGIYHLVPFLKVSDELRDKCWDVNVKGTWNCTKAVLPFMIEQKSGKIVNISSVTGPLVSAPGFTPYAMSKGAISAMTKSLALEVAPYGINVNAILPGSIDTPGLRGLAIERGNDPDQAMIDAGKTIPLGRVGSCDDVGRAAVFLASEYASYITGAELVVDGGNVIQELKRSR
jgi:NAD(P)-dependent dehydrogenase (short-subunit alcohol dehydrogenase family)